MFRSSQFSLVALVLICLGLTNARSSEKVAKDDPSEKNGTLEVVVKGLRNGKGDVLISLYNQSKGFPADRSAVFRKRKVSPSASMNATVTFSDLEFGDYAVAILHDEDRSGDMTYRLRTFPKEGYGFSNNPVIKVRAPTFSDSKVVLSKSSGKVEIKANY